MKYVARLMAPVFGVFIGRGIVEASVELIVVSSLAAALALGVSIAGSLEEWRGND